MAGVGLLYLLRGAGVADVGPHAASALPLQQLDGTDAQPLVRMALAWLPVGIAAGAVAAGFTRSSRAAALATITPVAALLLWLSTSASDAIANNERFLSNLTTPLSASGLWVSLVLLVIGVAAGEGLAAASRRAPSAA